MLLRAPAFDRRVVPAVCNTPEEIFMFPDAVVLFPRVMVEPLSVIDESPIV